MKQQLSIRRYGAYKDSGVEWLGEVPAHWVVTRNKDIFEERGDLSISGDETLLTVSHITGVTRRSEKNVNMFMAETMEGYKLCKAGDLIINTMWAWMGALGTANETGICSPAYGVYRPKKNTQYSHKYFDYLYRTSNAITEMTRNSKGIVSSRLRLYPKDFFQIQTALPDVKEQTAIAAYLDTQTAQLDRKIELLAQKAAQYGKLKQSLINETVTRGLDESVAMKDSGVEWIGEIPAHWEIKRVKDELNSLDHKRIPLSGEDRGRMTEQTYDYYGASGVIDKVEGYIFDEPTILLGEDGANLYSRSSPLAFIARGKYWVNNHAHILKPRKGDISFFCYLLEALDYTTLISGSAQPKLTAGQLNRVLLMVPPLAEQQAIAIFLDEKTSHIDRIIATLNTQIDKLRELRKTLINDIVTGKIKVA